jgi:predicted Abi (CAAX) family protease
MIALSTLSQRALLSVTTIPDAQGWCAVAGITLTTTATAGLVAGVTSFISPLDDYHPPWWSTNLTKSSLQNSDNTDDDDNNNKLSPSIMGWYYKVVMKPLSAFLFPSLVEEFVWRGLLIPHPASTTATLISGGGRTAVIMSVLAVHVLSHPIAGWTVWPRGRDVFSDPRFLLLATIVLGGATASYLVSGGSVWAATVTHGFPVMLWRDFFGGEAQLLAGQERDTNR